MQIGFVDRPGSAVSHLLKRLGGNQNGEFNKKIVGERVMVSPGKNGEEKGVPYLIRCALSWVYLNLYTPNDPVLTYSFSLEGVPEESFFLGEHETEEEAWLKLIANYGYYDYFGFAETQPGENPDDFIQLELALNLSVATASPQLDTSQTTVGS